VAKEAVGVVLVDHDATTGDARVSLGDEVHQVRREWRRVPVIVYGRLLDVVLVRGLRVFFLLVVVLQSRVCTPFV
jgi:hypothetical protein